MEIIDKQFLDTPWYGSRQMARYMQRQGDKCGRHRVRFMRLVPIYQPPNTSKKHPEHKIWPYLLKGLTIDRPNQVFGAQTLPISPCGAFFRIWSQSWTGTAARW